MANVPEVYALRSNRAHLDDTFTHIVDPSWLGTQLCGEDFITTEKKTNILTDAHGINDKVSRFLDAVEMQVRNEPTKYWKAFIAILNTQPALTHTVKRLESALGKFCICYPYALCMYGLYDVFNAVVEASKQSALERKMERNNHLLSTPRNKGGNSFVQQYIATCMCILYM